MLPLIKTWCGQLDVVLTATQLHHSIASRPLTQTCRTPPVDVVSSPRWNGITFAADELRSTEGLEHILCANAHYIC
jgi:hypothetical protein